MYDGADLDYPSEEMHDEKVGQLPSTLQGPFGNIGEVELPELGRGRDATKGKGKKGGRNKKLNSSVAV